MVVQGVMNCAGQFDHGEIVMVPLFSLAPAAGWCITYLDGAAPHLKRTN